MRTPEVLVQACTGKRSAAIRRLIIPCRLPCLLVAARIYAFEKKNLGAGRYCLRAWVGSDVVHLCVEGAKVPVDRLWPAEALLLNLWELQQHAISELRR